MTTHPWAYGNIQTLGFINDNKENKEDKEDIKLEGRWEGDTRGIRRR